MNKGITTLIAIAAIAFLSAFIKPNNWFLLQKDDFKILFPSSPTAEMDTIPNETGLLKVAMYNYQNEETSLDSNLMYQMIVTEFPPAFSMSTEKAFVKGIFDGAVKGGMANVNGKLLSQKELMVKDFPGREIRIGIEGDATITMRMILAKRKLFAMQTVSQTGQDKNANASKFFNSFDVK